MSTENPIVFCGFTSDRRPIIGGAFYMADSMGVPLSFVMDWAENQGCVISIPHFFACALEAGWDDDQVFAKIREALGDRSRGHDTEFVANACILLFDYTSRDNPQLTTAREIASKMRQLLENPQSRAAVSATSTVS